jgi:lipid A 4'-phosphatase
MTAIACLVFRNADIDLRFARHFYHPENKLDTWFEQNYLLWNFLYYIAPWMTGLLLIGSLVVLLAARLKENIKPYRIYAIYVFLLVSLGPGLFVNAIFKPYWGRPRPREVAELGGRQEYRCFYQPSIGSPGKSFPCGHCSVAFSFGLFWWLFRKKRPMLASGFLFASFVFGALMGVSRMSAGGHFLSDVIFSGLITYWVCYWLYYHGMRIPERELHILAPTKLNRLAQVLEKRKFVALAFYSVFSLATILAILFASPFNSEYALPANDPSVRLDSLVVDIDRGRVDMTLDRTVEKTFVITGVARGFGFPGNKVHSTCEVAKTGDIASESCEISRKGLFSDFESVIKITVNPDRIKSFALHLEHGEVFRDAQILLPAGYSIEAKP